ncbi:hypothetical protein KIN20_008971 [Parelaphostrongylus tenuis]|uniref:Uncharacterized protein n=1 Tax=Parelaphostrongylus tenuis TaxID=148309 RepID=A0AAD5MPY1_PARTN|nr:hypothetical protein KIN20_008971 [Parelaphostrongylus tenuis]
MWFSLGIIYLWGDFDQPLPGMPPSCTHLRIMKVSGLDKAGHPPPYSHTVNQPPLYPSTSPLPHSQATAPHIRRTIPHRRILALVCQPTNLNKATILNKAMMMGFVVLTIMNLQLLVYNKCRLDQIKQLIIHLRSRRKTVVFLQVLMELLLDMLSHLLNTVL